MRLHSFKASMLNAAVPHTLKPNGSHGHVGFPLESIAVVRALVHQILAGDNAALTKLNELLGLHKLSLEHLAAEHLREMWALRCK